jgi:hypothetical protein
MYGLLEDLTIAFTNHLCGLTIAHRLGHLSSYNLYLNSQTDPLGMIFGVLQENLV